MENEIDETQPTESDALTAQIAELNDKYLRAAAEVENTRRRAAIDAEGAARARAMSVASKFLPLVDAIVAAEKHSPDDQGVQSMVRAMDGALASVGITRIDAIGKPLDPQFHNAIQVADAAGTTPNTIIDEMQAGYMFGDTVLRPAMVVVAK